MKTRRNHQIVVAALLLAGLQLGLMSAAQAASIIIPSLYNTGVDNSGAPLANGAADTHYTLTSIPSSGYFYKVGEQATVLTEAGGYPASGLWIPSDGASAWITPGGAASGTNSFIYPQGDYTYQTTIDLTSVVTDSLVINGKWSTDDAGMDILVNGQSTGITTGSTSFHGDSWANFTISGPGLFHTGVNTLTFVTENDWWYNTGLRVEFTSVYGDLVPEPAPWMLLGLGLACLTVRRRPGSAA